MPKKITDMHVNIELISVLVLFITSSFGNGLHKQNNDRGNSIQLLILQTDETSCNKLVLVEVALHTLIYIYL